jgi:hypothetical protein
MSKSIKIFFHKIRECNHYVIKTVHFRYGLIHPTVAQLEIILISYISPCVRFDDQVAIIRGSVVKSPRKQPHVKNTRLRTLTEFCCHYTHEYVNSH